MVASDKGFLELLETGMTHLQAKDSAERMRENNENIFEWDKRMRLAGDLEIRKGQEEEQLEKLQNIFENMKVQYEDQHNLTRHWFGIGLGT